MSAQQAVRPLGPARRAAAARLLCALAERGDAGAGTATLADAEGAHPDYVYDLMNTLQGLGIVTRDSGRSMSPHGGNAEKPWRLLVWPDWAGARPAPLPLPAERLRPKTRRCLTCGDDFESQWCGNRRCDACAGALAGLNDRMLEAG